MISLHILTNLFLIIISGLSILTAAQNNTTNDQTPEKVGWVSSPNTRSTSDILWSCLSIFLVCSWKCVHLNVPSLEESDAGWYTLRGWPFWPKPALLKYALRKFKWMCIVAIAPELGVAMAMDQYSKARKLYQEFQHLDITMVHAFYAHMGGYVLALPRSSGEGAHDSDSETHSDRADAGSSLGISSAQKLEFYTLTSIEDFRYLDELKLFPATVEGEKQDRCLPVTTKGDICDKSKSDAFTKAFAVLQCGWLIIQSITRAAVGLPITELELTSLAFIFCAIIMYALWWDKPFDVQRPTLLLCLDEHKASLFRSWWKEKDAGDEIKARKKNLTIMTFGSYIVFNNKEREPHSALAYNISAAIFSGLHLIPWNWNFPSHLIQIRWRIFSVMATTTSIMPSLAMEAFSVLSPFISDNKSTLLAGSVTLIPILVYVVSRLGLIILVFYCFSSMPAGVYQTVDWNNIFPHFS